MAKNILRKTNIFVCVVIVAGFAVVFAVNYFITFKGNVEKIENISKMTSEGIYYRIESIFARPVGVSLTMANDNFLRAYFQGETLVEDDNFTETIKSYLNSYKEAYGYDSVFLASAKTRRYYNFNGVDRVLSIGNPENNWYFNFLESDVKYSLEVDNDEAAHDAITVFVNCRIKGDDEMTLGIVGVGFQVYGLQKLLREYAALSDVDIYLLDETGKIEIAIDSTGVYPKNFFDTCGYPQFKDEILQNSLKGETLTYWHKEQNWHNFVIAKYIPMLRWHLILEHNTESLEKEVQQQFYTTIIVVILTILIVSLIITYTITRYNKQIIELSALIAKREAKAETTAIKRFVANISHEIRTPMNGIIGLAELGLHNITNPLKQEDYLSKIVNSATRLLVIINNLLDLSKIDAGEFRLEKTPFFLQDVLSECKDINIYAAEKKGVMLYIYDKTEFADRIIGDPVKLKQALVNLLSNAVKFTNEGYVLLTVKCENIVETDGAAEVSFEIKDTGIGISEEQLAYIFEPFKQADNSATKIYGGTGLGLSITKNIVETMGGKIHVESVPNVGTTFSFSITFNVEKNSCPKTEKGRSLIVEQPLFAGDALVCDDNDMNIQVIAENLKIIGFNVNIAKNGKTAVAICAQRPSEKPFDIIFMDIQMPVMDGMAATEKLIEMGIKAPIIAVTASFTDKDEEKNKYFAIGMKDYICKPFRRQELWDCLLRHLPPVGKTSVVVRDGVIVGATKGAEVIDRELGIENAAGNEALYKKVLNEFFNNQRQTYVQLEKAIESKDYRLARQIAHKERGSAAIIGAISLSAILAGLEEVFASDTPDNSAIMMDEYSKELDNVLEYISDLKLT